MISQIIFIKKNVLEEQVITENDMVFEIYENQKFLIEQDAVIFNSLNYEVVSESVISKITETLKKLFTKIKEFIQRAIKFFTSKLIKKKDNNKEEYVDAGNKDAVAYVFVDALDVDPTFYKYRNSFKYAKEHGMFEPNKDLTPFYYDKEKWKDESYWVNLKRDFVENPSVERFNFIRKVVKVYLADKISKIQKERYHDRHFYNFPKN